MWEASTQKFYIQKPSKILGTIKNMRSEVHILNSKT